MNRQTSFSWLAVVAVALLGGCDSEPARSVEWYREHPAELKAKVIECSQQAALKSDAEGNCARARQAGLMDTPSGSGL
ncbi:EexN family lipoprotein [Xanthomonas campestris pv. campestris]|nr:EexN family lipoprotein [Xanthomonas campestris pv. campestris]MEB1844497.1 EexN family lipoprotein [Xanthomonas campestris pv. campestris]